MTNIIGLILCGGESKRMGTDKGLMPIQDTIRARFMAAKLHDLNLPVIYAININQLEQYIKYISSDAMVIDDNDIEGPARGMLAAHHKYPVTDFLLLACDMLQLDTVTLTELLTIYQQQPGYDFYVYQDKNYAQPFCGIYTAAGISSFEQRIIASSITNISMQSILNNGATKRLTIKNDKAFENFNFQT